MIDAPNPRAWARSLFQRRDWLVLDCETTGLSPQAEPVEIALVSSAGVICWRRLLRPATPVDPGAARIHGLDDAALAGACDFREVGPQLYDLLRGRIIIAYHAVFDHSVLQAAWQRRSLPQAPCRWECALDRYQQWRGFRPTLSLACEIEGIPFEAVHRAGPDALLVWRLLRRMAGG